MKSPIYHFYVFAEARLCPQIGGTSRKQVQGKNRTRGIGERGGALYLHQFFYDLCTLLILFEANAEDERVKPTIATYLAKSYFHAISFSIIKSDQKLFVYSSDAFGKN